MPVTLERLTQEELLALARELNDTYGQFREAGLALDLTRGKPSPSQLALADTLDTGDAGTGSFIATDGTDTRNYGGLDGLAEARALGAELLGVRPDEAGDGFVHDIIGIVEQSLHETSSCRAHSGARFRR